MLSHTQIVIFLKKKSLLGQEKAFVGQAQSEQRGRVAHGGRAVLEVVGALVTLVESWF